MALFDIPGFDAAGELAALGGGPGFGVLTADEITNGYIVDYLLPVLVVEPAQASNREASLDLPIPVGGEVTQAVVRITAAAPGLTDVAGIGDVRAASGDPTTTNSIVVDFAVLRTVSEVRAPAGFGISSVAPWIGTKFDGGLFFEGAPNRVDFTEIQTERLLVGLNGTIAPDSFASGASVRTSTPPADLELFVGGTRVTLRQGPAPVGFTEDVDITTAVQAAVGVATPGTDGQLHVPVVLKARVPGVLGLSIPGDVRFLRTLTVDFPGPTKAVRFAEEGMQQVELPLPPGSEAWTIHRVVAALAADDPGPLRVLPPVGPAISHQAEIVLDPNRRLAARLPIGPRGRLPTISGVRLLLQVDTGGIEIGGALLAGTPDEPGEPLTDATFTPVVAPAGAAPAWVTVSLPQPLEPPADVTDVWASFSVTRGKAVLALADEAIIPADDLTRLRRIAPNGIAHPPSTATLNRTDPAQAAVAVGTGALAMRVAGVAPDDAPVGVVDIDLDGGNTVRAPGAPGTVAITLDPAEPRSPLGLNVTATAATTVTVGPVVVAYTEGATP